MSYRIDYNPAKRRIYPTSASRKPKWLVVALVIMVAIFTLQKFDKLQDIKTWLLPGNPDITGAAFSTMIKDVKAGEPVGEAITAFCVEIINNG